MKVRSLDGLLILVCAIALLAFVPKLFWPDSWLYRDVITERVLLNVGGLSKLAFLAVATAFGVRAARGLEPGNPARLPWMLLALGIGVFLAGQCILGVYQLWLQVPSPFPSAATCSSWLPTRC